MQMNLNTYFVNSFYPSSLPSSFYPSFPTLMLSLPPSISPFQVLCYPILPTFLSTFLPPHSYAISSSLPSSLPTLMLSHPPYIPP